MGERDDRRLDAAYPGLEAEVPDQVARAIRWLRDPKGRWVRLPLGIALVTSGFLGFLPILGFEFIPLGLLLLAQDLPWLRGPVGTATLWMEEKWRRLKRHFHR